MQKPYSDEPDVYFGRFTDKNKTKDQYENWEKALSLYREKKYIDSFCAFFNYLKDKTVDNVFFEREESKITFKILQGSKIVTGTINNREIQAEAELVRFESLEIPVMRKLLHENSLLYFSKYAIKNDLFTLKFFSPIEDVHPESFYLALKELATESDKYDDVLVEEFSSLQPINTGHIETIPETEKIIKLKYLRKWIEHALKLIKEYDTDRLEGSVSYFLLNLAYKIHFLLAPEGKLLDDIRYIQSIFFENDETTLKEKNYRMIEEFNNILNVSDPELLKSFYRVKATFGVGRPLNYEQLSDFVQGEMNKMKWFIENKYPEIVKELCEYIISYPCFNFDLPAATNDLIMIVWRVFNPEFFNELGFKEKFYDANSEKFNSEAIKKRINDILLFAKKKSPRVQFNIKNLDFRSINSFAISFINEFQNFKLV